MSTRERIDQAWVEVSLDNVLNNARTIRRRQPRAKLLPMVKANAYGLGVIPIAKALEPLSPWGFGVATVEEAAELRNAGIELPIVAFTTALERKLHEFHQYDVRPVLDDPRVMKAWNRPFHLEIDTGMARGGVPWHDREAIRVALACQPEGIFTHLHSADTSPASVQLQLDRFESVRNAVSFPRHALVHVANSAGSFRVGTDSSVVRPGIFLYGGGVGPDLPTPEPVAALRARIVSTRSVLAGESVSYGADWVAERDTTVATLGIGYADGVRRSIQGHGMVVVGGARVPVVGRVTMDMTMVALPDAKKVVPGDAVTLFGPCAGPAVTLDEFASWAGTISYEILTGLGTRLPRMYV